METHFYAAGEQIDQLTFAGQDMLVCEQDGIKADVFEQLDSYLVPCIESRSPGGGKLNQFLNDLRNELPKLYKPIVFVNVVNPRLKIHLEKRGITCIRMEVDHA